MPAPVATDRFEFERELTGRGCVPLAGVDEAGRGPLAGPVVAAAVILPGSWILDGLPQELAGLNDSKQLTPAQREAFFDQLIQYQVQFAVAEIDSIMIDTINILQATHAAMNRALALLNPAPVHALVDGLFVRTLEYPQTAIVQGDCRSYSIAAASIIAKVLRDRLMTDLDLVYPGYGFASHKGYATTQHFEALRRLGPCPVHRRSFSPLRPTQGELFALHVPVVSDPAQV